MKKAKQLVDRLGLRFAARQVRAVLQEIRVLARHWRGRILARRYRGSRGLKLNVGCGPNLKPGWVNIDLFAASALQLDLRKALPFRSESCSMIYSEHFLEHLDYPDDAREFLRECLRVLEPNGLLSTGVPNAEAALCWYVTEQQRNPDGAPTLPWPGHPENVRTPIEKINFLFRQNYHYAQPEHRFAYDLATLSACLTDAGFVSVHSRPYDAAFDSASRADSTLYVDARKPR